jgi:hypothetical protein
MFLITPLSFHFPQSWKPPQQLSLDHLQSLISRALLAYPDRWIIIASNDTGKISFLFLTPGGTLETGSA